MNCRNRGICRSVEPSTPVLYLLQRERLPPREGCLHLPAAAVWLGLSGMGAVMGLHSLKNHVQPRARADATAADSPSLPALRCSEARAASCRVKGPPCSHPSSACQPTLGPGKELKQPNGPLLFNNFGTFHNLPYHAANSCALALATTKGNARAERCIFCM